MSRVLRACLAMLCLQMAAVGAASPAERPFQPAQLRDFPRDTLTIQRGNGRDTFQIWLAQTSAEQQQGLMWLQELPADHGMLFILAAPRPMYMWMKNTYVSLDMLFVNATGRITHIVRDATPLSEAIISSEGEVSGVLEIRSGEAKRRGITVGDQVQHRAFGSH